MLKEEAKPSKRARMARRLCAVTLLVGSVACLAGCGTSLNNNNPTAFSPTPAAQRAASKTADQLTAAATPGSGTYKIGPLDVLDVSVFNVPDLTRTVQVADTGTINYPLVGEVRAAGQTAREFERGLAARLNHYVQSPQVTVLVKEFNSQRVTISGSVRNTGAYPLKGNTSLMQALALAGDLDVNVASGEVVIFRTINGVRSAARFDFDAIREGKADDPQLQPGDVIVVDTSPAKVALSNIMKVLPLLGAAAIFTPL
jgi:polysaccharide biosynthesis/export protein